MPEAEPIVFVVDDEDDVRGAIARLLALSFPSLYSRDTLSFTLGFFDQVARAVPCNAMSSGLFPTST